MPPPSPAWRPCVVIAMVRMAAAAAPWWRSKQRLVQAIGEPFVLCLSEWSGCPTGSLNCRGAMGPTSLMGDGGEEEPLPLPLRDLSGLHASDLIWEGELGWRPGWSAASAAAERSGAGGLLPACRPPRNGTQRWT